MPFHPRSWRDVAAAVARATIGSALLGAAVGLPVLGVGGRAAMYVIARLNGPPPSFTIDGTMAVLVSGTGSGAAAGVIHLVLASLLPTRPRLRAGLFLLVLGGLTLRGLRPLDAQRIALFAPLMALFASLYLAAWRTRERRSAEPSLARSA